jgi:hypothetical protein
MKKIIAIALFILCLSIAEAQASPNLHKRGRKAKRTMMLRMYQHSGTKKCSKFYMIYQNQWEAPKEPIWYPAYKAIKRINLI